LKLDPDVLEAAKLLIMFTQAYWTRLWIVQELYLAQEVTFWYRDQVFSKAKLLDQLRSVSRRGLRLRKFPERLAKDLMRRADTFYGYFQGTFKLASKLEHMLRDTSREYQSGLRQVLAIFGNNQCVDLRDRVFGLQAVIRVEDRVAVDYSKSPAMVICAVLVTLITQYFSLERTHNPQHWILLLSSDTT
jgi:hypothetical protein